MTAPLLPEPQDNPTTTSLGIHGPMSQDEIDLHKRNAATMLQNGAKFPDVDAYLAAHGVPKKKPTVYSSVAATPVQPAVSTAAPIPGAPRQDLSQFGAAPNREGTLQYQGKVDPTMGLVLAYTHGATYGFDKDAMAALAGTVHRPELAANIEATRQQFAKEQPGLNTVGELAGAVTSPITKAIGSMGLAGKIAPAGSGVLRTGLGAAAEGAVAGGVAGAGFSQGDLWDRFAAMVPGAFGGAGMAGGISIGAGLAAKVLRPAAAWLESALKAKIPGVSGVEEQADQLYLNAMERDKLTPDHLIERVKHYQATGTPPTAATIGGENISGLAEAAAQRPGPMRAQMTEQAEAIRAGTPERLVQAITQGKAGLQNTYQLAQDLLDARSTKADELYQAAFKNPDGTLRTVEVTDEMKKLLDHPVVKKGLWRRAQELGRGALDPVEIPNLPGTTPPNPMSAMFANAPPSFFENNPHLAKMLGKDAGPVEVPMQGLHYLKMAMDEAAKNAGAPGATSTSLGIPEGTSITRTSAGQLKARLGQLLDNIDKQNPEYTRARAFFRTASEELDALETGRRSITAPPDLVQSQLADMSQTGREMYRTGHLNALAQKVYQDPGTLTRGMGMTYKNQGMAQKLRLIFGDDADQILDKAVTEAKTASRLNSMLGNSRTAYRQTAEQELGQPVDLAIGAVTGGPAGIFRAAVGGLKAKMNTGWSDAIGEALAKRFTKSPNELLNWYEGLKHLSPKFVGLSPTAARVIGQQTGQASAEP